MTSEVFSNLSDEIFLLIFKKLPYCDLRECLTVCRSWHGLVQYQLRTNVRLQSDRGIELFLNRIKKNPEIAATVNRLDLHIGSHQQRLSTQMIRKLFDRKFDITELRVNSAMLFIREGVKSNVFKACPKLKHICCWDKLACSMSRQKLPKGVLKPESRLEEQSDLPVLLYMDMQYDTFSRQEYTRLGKSRRHKLIYYGASGTSYVYSSFPSMGYTSWLTLFRQQFTLETLKVELNRGKGAFTCPRQGLDETETKTIENLSKLKSLQVKNKLFCTIPVQFISEYMTGLQELKLTQKIAFEESWTDTQLQEFYNSLSDLLSRLHSCDVHLLVRKGTVFPSTIIENFYQQPSPSHHHSKRIFELSVGIFDQTITLISEKYGNEKAQKLVTFEFEKESSLDTLVNSIISTMKIDAFKFSRYGPNFPDDYVQVFQSTLDNLPDATEVSYCMSSATFTSEKTPWKQYPQVTHLEIYPGEDTIYFPVWKGLTRVFNNTASLKLSHSFGFMLARRCDVRAQDLKLECLCLDISAIWNNHVRNQPSRSKFFTVDVQSKGQRHFYKILIEGLRATKISNNEDIEEFKKKEYPSNHLEIRVWVDEVQFITLYLDRYFYNFEYIDEEEQSKNGSEISLHLTQ